MAKTLKRLFGPALLTGTSATKYTVPASTVGVIQQIHVNNESGGAIGFTASIGADATGTQIFTAQSIPANTAVDFFGQYIMTAAEVFAAFGSTTNTLNLTLFGYELTNN